MSDVIAIFIIVVFGLIVMLYGYIENITLIFTVGTIIFFTPIANGISNYIDNPTIEASDE